MGTLFDMRTSEPLDFSGTVILRRELIEEGYSDHQIRMALQAGIYARVRHGAYVDAPR